MKGAYGSSPEGGATSECVYQTLTPTAHLTLGVKSILLAKLWHQVIGRILMDALYLDFTITKSDRVKRISHATCIYSYLEGDMMALIE